MGKSQWVFHNDYSSPPSTRVTRTSFSVVHCETMVSLLKIKPTNVLVPLRLKSHKNFSL